MISKSNLYFANTNLYQIIKMIFWKDIIELVTAFFVIMYSLQTIKSLTRRISWDLHTFVSMSHNSFWVWFFMNRFARKSKPYIFLFYTRHVAIVWFHTISHFCKHTMFEEFAKFVITKIGINTNDTNVGNCLWSYNASSWKYI